MMKSFFLQAKNGILLVILLVVSGTILFMPFIFRAQKHSFLYLATLVLKIIALPVFAVSLISLVTLGFIKITQAIKLPAGVFLILALLLALGVLYIPLWLRFKPNIPDFDPLNRYTIHYANPLNTQVDYVDIDYLNKEVIGVEIQQTSLNRYQDKLNYNEFVEIITALNELRNKSRYSLVTCPVKFLSSYMENSLPYLRLNGASFYFHPERRFLFQRGFVFPQWCYSFPKLENDPHRVILDLVNERLPSEANRQAPGE